MEGSLKERKGQRSERGESVLLAKRVGFLVGWRGRGREEWMKKRREEKRKGKDGQVIYLYKGQAQVSLFFAVVQSVCITGKLAIEDRYELVI